MTTYPLCFSCARIVTGLTPLDTVHHDDPLTRTQIAAFLEAAGPLTITDTNNVPDTIEWTCAACGEISTGPARWATATSTDLQGTDLSSLYPDVLLWLHTTRPDWAISVYDCGHSGRWPQINLPDGTVIRFSEDEDRTSTWTACRFCPDHQKTRSVRPRHLPGTHHRRRTNRRPQPTSSSNPHTKDHRLRAIHTRLAANSHLKRIPSFDQEELGITH